jgi:hypothetical protein
MLISMNVDLRVRQYEVLEQLKALYPSIASTRRWVRRRQMIQRPYKSMSRYAYQESHSGEIVWWNSSS